MTITCKLKATYTPELAKDLNSMHIISNQTLIEMLSNQISMEIDTEILKSISESDCISIDKWNKYTMLSKISKYVLGK